METPTEHIPPNEGEEQAPNGGQQGQDVPPNEGDSEPDDHEEGEGADA